MPWIRANEGFRRLRFTPVKRDVCLGLLLVAAVFWALGHQMGSLKKRKPGAGVSAQVSQTKQEPPSMEAREARMASVQLARQTLSLRRELAETKRQVMVLSEALAEAKAESDLGKLRRSKSALDEEWTWSASGAMTRDVVRLLDVSEPLGMVVVDAGRKDGVRPGMVFNVTRGQQNVARVRVADVRDAISGAVIEEVRLGGFPEKGDHVVLWKQPGR